MKTLLYLLKESVRGRSDLSRRLARESLVEKINSLRHWKEDYRPRNALNLWKVLLRPLSFRAGISSLAAVISTGFAISTCQNSLTGAAYNPVGTTARINKSYSLGTSVSNGASGGCDEVFSFQQGIAAGASATLDLSAMTNLLQQAGTNIVRIKAYQIRLLSASDDATITPAPNNSSTVTVTNFGTQLPCQLDFGHGGSGLSLNVTVSGSALATATVNAAGSGYPPSTTFLVNVNQAGGTGGAVAVTTNASGVPVGTPTIVNAGTGYTGAGSLATTMLGAYNILTGGAHMYFDPGASGFCTVSSTVKNIRFYNLDVSNAITVEVDVLGATS